MFFQQGSPTSFILETSEDNVNWITFIPETQVSNINYWENYIFYQPGINNPTSYKYLRTVYIDYLEPTLYHHFYEIRVKVWRYY